MDPGLVESPSSKQFYIMPVHNLISTQNTVLESAKRLFIQLIEDTYAAHGSSGEYGIMLVLAVEQRTFLH